MAPQGSALRFGVLLLAAVSLVVASSFLGPAAPEHSTTPALTRVIYWQYRVPRTALAACAGAGLALGGVVFQTLFRNPLATPYTLGLASGASCAAAIAFLANVGGRLAGVPVLSLAAFAGAVVAMGMIFLMARLRSGSDMTRLLLAGVCVAYLCSAGILLATFLADRAITNEIVVWMMGSLAVHRPQAAVEVGVVLGITLALALGQHRALDLLALGDQLAASRGVAVGLVVWSSFAAVGLLVAVIVANCGPIGFVGLMVPHIARAVVGQRTLPLALGAITIGAAFLATCDAVARSLFPFELPVGVVTNMLGAVFFFYLLATREVAYTSTN